MDSWSKLVYLLQNYHDLFLEGIEKTLFLAIVGSAIGLIVGMALALLRNLHSTKRDSTTLRCFKGIGKWFSIIYIELFRGTPLMVQAMIMYFYGKMYLGLTWSADLCGLIVLSLNTAAYMAEDLRSGINSVDKGQIEAARSLGFSHFQTMFFIVFPQALKNSIPTLLNEYIMNIKDSSVLNVISVTELYMTASIASSSNYMVVESYIIIAVVYLVLTLIASGILRIVEKKLSSPYVKKVAHIGRRENGNV
jgi:putative lysine transport system permease protein